MNLYWHFHLKLFSISMFFFLTMFYDGAAVAHGWFSQVLDPASMLVVREPASKSMENRPIPQVWKSWVIRNTKRIWWFFKEIQLQKSHLKHIESPYHTNSLREMHPIWTPLQFRWGFWISLVSHSESFASKKGCTKKPPKFPASSKWHFDSPEVTFSALKKVTEMTSKPGHFQEPKRSRTFGLYLSEPFKRG